MSGENSTAWQAHLASMREKEALLRGKHPEIGSAWDGVYRNDPSIEVYQKPSVIWAVMNTLFYFGVGLLAFALFLLILWIPEILR